MAGLWGSSLNPLNGLWNRKILDMTSPARRAEFPTGTSSPSATTPPSAASHGLHWEGFLSGGIQISCIFQGVSYERSMYCISRFHLVLSQSSVKGTLASHWCTRRLPQIVGHAGQQRWTAWASPGSQAPALLSPGRAEAAEWPLPAAAATYAVQECCRRRCHHAWAAAVQAAADVSQWSDGFRALEGHNLKVKINSASLAFKHLPLLFGERGCLSEPSRGNASRSGDKGINYS